MKAKPVVLLDLDFTLFASDIFLQAAAEVLAARFGLSAPQFLQQVPRYYTSPDPQALRNYQFFEHVAACGIESAVAEAVLRADLAGQDFLYPDANAFLTFSRGLTDELLILSYGEIRYQVLKYELSASLQAVPFVAILEPKHDYIARMYPGQAGYLIDDKDGAVPPNFKLLRVDRRDHTAPFATLADLQHSWPR